MMSLIIFLSFEITSCRIKKDSVKYYKEGNENKESVKLDFEILTDEISLDEIKKISDFKEKLTAYSNFEILARLKYINKTIESIELYNFITYENFEITNVKKENKNELIRFYDYTPIIDPETYELYGIRNIKPNEYFIDTINLMNNFEFLLSNPDTFLIRIKNQQFEKEIYSTWDTLILK